MAYSGDDRKMLTETESVGDERQVTFSQANLQAADTEQRAAKERK